MAITTFLGGRPDPFFPAFGTPAERSGDRRSTTPLPKRFAERVHNGHFTPDAVFHPSCDANLRGVLAGKTGPQKINVLAIPSNTILRASRLHIEPRAACPGDLSGCGPFGCRGDVATGLLLNVNLVTFDASTPEKAQAIIDGTAVEATSVPMYTAKDASIELSEIKSLGGDIIVKDTEFAVVQLEFTNWPATDTTLDYTDLETRIAVCLDAVWFDHQLIGG